MFLGEARFWGGGVTPVAEGLFCDGRERDDGPPVGFVIKDCILMNRQGGHGQGA